MTSDRAKHIGQNLAIKSALAGLVIAYITFCLILYNSEKKLTNVIFWIFNVDFWFNLLVGSAGLLAMAYFFGRLAGTEILVKKKNEYLTGVKYGFLILVTGCVFGSSVEFLEELADDNRVGDLFFDYYVKPMFWVLMFGLVPVILVGLWFGRQVKQKGLKP